MTEAICLFVVPIMRLLHCVRNDVVLCLRLCEGSMTEAICLFLVPIMRLLRRSSSQ